MIWRTIHYDWPQAAFLLFFVGFFVWALVALNNYRKRHLKAFGSADVLQQVVEKRDPVLFWIKVALYCTAWVLATLALMQPKGNAHYISPEVEKNQTKPQPLRRLMQDLVFLIDVSASMAIPDGSSGKTRLDTAKEISDNIISRLNGQYISLYAFTSAFLQSVPSNTDYIFTRLMLRELSLNEDETVGTNIKQALENVQKEMMDMPTSNAKALIIFTDGDDTHLEDLKGEDYKRAVEEIAKTLKINAEQRWGLFIVGIGTKEGMTVPNVSYQGHAVVSSLNEILLRQMSLNGQGELLIANEMTSWQISQHIIDALKKQAVFSEEPNLQLSTPEAAQTFDLYFQIPLGIAILALALALILPDTRKARKKDEG